jgi:PilZ domain
MNSTPDTIGPRMARRTARLACQVVRLRDFRLVADTALDLSRAGMLVGPADPVLTGEALIVSFRVPGLSNWIDAEAVVRRVVHGRRPGETSRALGIELVGLDDCSRRLIGAYMRRLVPAPPNYRSKPHDFGRWRRRLAGLLAAAPLFA